MHSMNIMTYILTLSMAFAQTEAALHSYLQHYDGMLNQLRNYSNVDVILLDF